MESMNNEETGSLKVKRRRRKVREVEENIGEGATEKYKEGTTRN